MTPLWKYLFLWNNRHLQFEMHTEDWSLLLSACVRCYVLYISHCTAPTWAKSDRNQDSHALSPEEASRNNEEENGAEFSEQSPWQQFSLTYDCQLDSEWLEGRKVREWKDEENPVIGGRDTVRDGKKNGRLFAKHNICWRGRFWVTSITHLTGFTRSHTHIHKHTPVTLWWLFVRLIYLNYGNQERVFKDKILNACIHCMSAEWTIDEYIRRETNAMIQWKQVQFCEKCNSHFLRR